MESPPEAGMLEYGHPDTTRSDPTKPAAVLNAEMIATMSHELRSPLTSIKGYATTLLLHEHRISSEEQREFLQAVKEASEHLELIIDQLLEIGKLEADAVTMERVPVNLAYLVREAITIQERRLRKRREKQIGGQARGQIVFRLRFEDQCGRPVLEEPVIQTDRRSLREVLDQLLENAVLNSPDGGVIQVVLRIPGEPDQASGPGNEKIGDDKSIRLAIEKTPTLEICVHDQGTGIPSEQIERIFEHFHRVDTRLTREVGGLGLGLTICKKIIELHHGKIWVESEVGKGSIFHVWLPGDAPEGAT